MRDTSCVWYLVLLKNVPFQEIFETSDPIVVLQKKNNQKPLSNFTFKKSRNMSRKSYNLWSHDCVKSVQIRSYFWSVFSCIRTEYRKIWTRNNSVFEHFSRNALLDAKNVWKLSLLLLNCLCIVFNIIIKDILYRRGQCIPVRTVVPWR